MIGFDHCMALSFPWRRRGTGEERAGSTMFVIFTHDDMNHRNYL